MGAKSGELVESPISQVDLCNGEFLELGCKTMVEFILQIIIRDTSLSSKVQKFREEVVEMVSILHIELLELILRSSDSVWVFVDGLQVFNYVVGVMVQVDGFVPEPRSDMLPGLAITPASHIGAMQLGGVVMVMVGIQLLSHQEKPVLKSGFFTISKQRRIRDLSRFARGRSLSPLSCNMVIRVQQVSSQSVGIGVTVCRSKTQTFFQLSDVFLRLSQCCIPSLSSNTSSRQTVLTIIDLIVVLLMHLEEFFIESFRSLLAFLQEEFTSDFMLFGFISPSIDQDGVALFWSVHSMG